MTTKIIVQLNDEEIEQITDTQNLITDMYNELVLDEAQNKEALDLLTKIQEDLDQIVYQFCNDKYREIHY